ncbi:histone acetyltransferase [Anaeramoeba flamelloides]|uniref:histone acetyltransferase n=1 Tax=Anaeramoeba flamelloides TaxID=1746091 RepID=A0AAV7Z638_9EUKA|nr:histone acetyltransferase [Anaeramoeba flamelloides]
MSSSLKNVTIGTVLPCKFQNNNYYDCEILEIRTNDKNQLEYYVHFTEFNKRLDGWVLGSRLKTDQIKSNKNIHTITPKRLTRTRTMEGRKSNQKGRVVSISQFEKDQQEKENKLRELMKVRNIDTVWFGKCVLEPWYYSPYPTHIIRYRKIYICEFCFNYFDSERSFFRHMIRCNVRHPPGIEIYQEDNLSIFEVDGENSKEYCQNLFLLSKLFLDHKSLTLNTELFLFYILCENDNFGCHIAGYFSKEKHPTEKFNLACILVLPQFQRKGYGKLLISLSYELSKIEKKIGSPEKPLSDLGLITYRNYWSIILVNILKDYIGQSMSLKELSKITYFIPEEIQSTLQWLDLIYFSKPNYFLNLENSQIIKKYTKKFKNTKFINSKLLKWVPYDKYL